MAGGAHGATAAGRDRPAARRAKATSGLWIAAAVAVVGVLWAYRDALAPRARKLDALHATARGPLEHTAFLAAQPNFTADILQSIGADETSCTNALHALVTYFCGPSIAAAAAATPAKHSVWSSEQLLDLIHAAGRAATSGRGPLPTLLLRGQLLLGAARHAWQGEQDSSLLRRGAGGLVHGFALLLRPDGTWDVLQAFNGSYGIAQWVSADSGGPHGRGYAPLPERGATEFGLALQVVEEAKAWTKKVDAAFAAAFRERLLLPGASAVRALPPGIAAALGLEPPAAAASNVGGDGQPRQMQPLRLEWDIVCRVGSRDPAYASRAAASTKLVQLVSDGPLRLALHELLLHKRDSYDPEQ